MYNPVIPTPFKYRNEARLAAIAALWLLLACCVFGQVVPFPTTAICAGVSNPIKVAPTKASGQFNITGGGYSGDMVVAQCQWGPGFLNSVTQAASCDVITCAECPGKGRWPVSRPCDTHQGTSKVFASPDLGNGADTYAIADNYKGNCSNNGPGMQFYTIHNGVASYSMGADFQPNQFYGFKNGQVWFLDAPCSVVNVAARTVTFNQQCPTSFDALAQTDGQGRKWVISGIPNGLQVLASGPSPTPTSPIFTSTPVATATATPVVVTVTPTPTSPGGTPTFTPSGPCPPPCFVILTCTPGAR